MTMGQYMDDLEEINRVVQLYVDGANGDVAKLEEAFHPNAWMFGHVGEMNTYFPIEEFFKMVTNMPGLAGPAYRARVTSIDVAGDAAVATLAEEDYMGCDFVDYFSLARIDGVWKIVNKTYAHTGGEPPSS
jgi:hypothetical protein